MDGKDRDSDNLAVLQPLMHRYVCPDMIRSRNPQGTAPSVRERGFFPMKSVLEEGNTVVFWYFNWYKQLLSRQLATHENEG